MNLRPGSFLKLWGGFLLMWTSGGFLLVLIGLLPAATILSLVGLLTFGTMTAAVQAIMAVLGLLWLLIGVPLAVRGAVWFEEGLDELLGVSLGVTKALKKGTARIPVIKQLIKAGGA
jgi:hypothetical protein